MSENENSAPDQPVVALIEILKEQLELDCDFSLQTDGKLTCLVDIELLQKACIHNSLMQDSSSIALTDTLSDLS